nr:MAG TPA: hypothetical protein [Caudoviricetes sp.]
MFFYTICSIRFPRLLLQQVFNLNPKVYRQFSKALNTWHGSSRLPI